MKRRRHAPEQIVGHLRDAETMASEGLSIAEICKKLGVSEQTEDDRTLRILVVVDEYTRRSLALEVGRHFTSQDVIEIMRVLFEIHGAPTHVRSDNGSELIAVALRRWLARRGTGTLFIKPGSPWGNAYGESFNSRLRDELLDREMFTSLLETRVLLEQHRKEHNETRPHSSLDYQTAEAFFEGCLTRYQNRSPGWHHGSEK